MPQVIDVTGLSPEAGRTVCALVELLRGQPSSALRPSIFDLIGKAPTLRAGEEIAQQVR